MVKSSGRLAAKISTEGGRIRSHERDFSVLAPGQEHLLELSYLQLEEKNLEVKAMRFKGMKSDDVRQQFLTYLTQERGIKAITVFFSDLEGRLHLLDYDKKFVVGSEDNLTFDGSSIRGFTPQKESDLRLKLDWTTFRWAPADLFGPGKALVFANVMDKDGSVYDSDFRGRLDSYTRDLRAKRDIVVNIGTEIEGFVFRGGKAEQSYDEAEGFELVTTSGYYSSLPQDDLRKFIDKFAEAKRALGFENEKDHAEVAPAQFELNFKYSTALDAADQVQLYKLLARQVAATMGFTACFLPKPVVGINGSGMHTNMSLSIKDKNVFYDKKGKESLSDMAYRFVTGILYRGQDMCLTINSSVNAYRRLDPHYEAPNEIKVSASDRGSMVRIPIGNEKSSRIEVRTVAPDANPYLGFYAIIQAGMAGMDASPAELKKMEAVVYKKDVEKLPGEIQTAIANFVGSDWMRTTLGKENHTKYAELKSTTAERSPRSLGTRVKAGEVLYHHEVTNQLIWKSF